MQDIDDTEQTDGKEKNEKIIKVKPSGHTIIKVQAAQHGMSMGDYIVSLATQDK